ncbi:glucosamine-6-phosphate deaminase [uncultured spirochete]|jgi:glucosamine-6-phosphate deaminase|uniref:Glucosamine-6-phosphate deaminase n=1 Tax=uncultured spirochete TaxID=156406 RepID=A0A3P3XRZ7_9SPIR|nr:glucosamine-6-phosphate deaminase [uncultured spirochete]
MRVIVQNNYDFVSRWAAHHVVQRINEHQGNTPFVLGLPTGSTPLGMYNELIRLNKAGVVSFKNAVTFNMDEYVGLPSKDERSYHYFMWDNLFSHIDIKKENVHIPDGMAPDLDKECRRYEEAIKQAGGIDLFVGGVGADGHIAFNEPGSSLSSRTRIKTLTRDTKLANARFFDGDPEKVPSHALTVGMGTIMDAREVLIMVSGIEKARALRHAVEMGVNHMWTISCLQLHPKAILVCDDDATSELRVGTVRYFKEIEAPNLTNWD